MDEPLSVSRLPVAAAVAALRAYRRVASPLLSAALGPSLRCRFSPSCSQYAEDALRRHGGLAGGALAAKRLLRCTPLHPGGWDPVPERLPGRKLPAAPRCTRVVS